jgi:hypothetical protein
MGHTRLVVEFDEDDGWVTFSKENARDQDYDSLQLRHKFTVDHLMDAAVATNWVVQRNAEYWIESSISAKTLVEYVREMLDYFDGPDRPKQCLVQVVRAAHGYLGWSSAQKSTIPLWGYAWLDLSLREEVGEAARSTSDLWSGHELTIDLEKLRQARLEKFAAQYSDLVSSKTRDSSRMAPSRRDRRSESQGRADAG